ncbi:hypothetical protein F5X99DRAFT_425885 [Biscogniauxia marginata]|nr:hypothetical protein F5X99DRAFT_425885 [Biscogniauxia marginata]
MPNPSYLQARIEAASSSSPAAGSTPPSSAATSSLSLGAIIGIAIGGSVILFAALTPMLMMLARWQDRWRAEAAATIGASCPISSSTFADGSTGHDNPEESSMDKGAPRRLRKKSVTSELYDPTMVAVMAGARGRQSLPVLSPVVSRPGSLMNLGEAFAAVGARGDSRDGVAGDMVKKQRSPEKQRGYMIYQHRRRASWIDEDALHGPSISSPGKKNKNATAKRNPSWVANFGRGLGRSLSRRFSVRRGAAGSSHLVGRSPTLPYTETRQHSGSASPSRSAADADEKLVVAREDVRSVRDIEEGIATAPAQHQHQHQNHHYQNQVETVGTPRKAYTPRSADPSPKRPSNAAMLHNNGNSNNDIPGQRSTIVFDAAQRLAGGARVPMPMSMSMPASPVGPVGPRPQHRRMTQSNTDAELQAILRRTAERLQDGNRSARRQTMMQPATTSSLPSSPMRVPDGNASSRDRASAPGTPAGGASGRYDRAAAFSSKTSSPAKSHKSAPAVLADNANVRAAELDGGSLQVPGASSVTAQSQDQSKTARRHTRQMSQLSQTSMVSEADSLVASRRGSQADMIQTPLSSPSRSGLATTTPPANSSQPHPQIRQLVAVSEMQRPFSMASTESSALSTVYSEEEASLHHRSPPMSNGNLKASGAKRSPIPSTLMERQAMEQALSACDAFVKRSSQMSLDGVGGPKPPLDNSSASPRPLRVRKGTLSQTAAASQDPQSSPKASTTRTAAATTSHEQQRKSPKTGSHATTPKTAGRPLSFTIHALDDAANDPFTVATPSPPPAMTTRLSKLFSPLPAKDGPGVSNPSSPRSQHSPSSKSRPSEAQTTPRPNGKDHTPTRSPASRPRVVMPPPHVLHAAATSGEGAAAVGGGSRNSSTSSSRTSQASEGGLSSVYESYAHRNSSYSSFSMYGYGGGGGANENDEDTGTVATSTARNSVVTMITVTDPTTAATSPTRGGSNSSSSNGFSPSGRESRFGFRGRDILASSRQQQQQQRLSGIVARPAAADGITITVKSPTSPHHYHHQQQKQHLRTASSESHHSAASSSSSRYSQDEEEEAANTVPPLLLPSRARPGHGHGHGHHRSGAQHSVSITSSRYTRVASAVAELRRMNSQVSCVSTTSESAPPPSSSSASSHGKKKTTTKDEKYGEGEAEENKKPQPQQPGASPTLPDLRGGGFSPGRSGTRAGGRNYLALGVTATTTTTTPVAITAIQEKQQQQQDNSGATTTPARGSVAKAARDLEGGGWRGDEKDRTDAARSSLMTHADKLVRQREADKRASVESLGLYDAQGFLKGSPQRQSFLSPGSKP